MAESEIPKLSRAKGAEDTAPSRQMGKMKRTVVEARSLVLEVMHATYNRQCTPSPVCGPRQLPESWTPATGALSRARNEMTSTQLLRLCAEAYAAGACHAVNPRNTVEIPIRYAMDTQRNAWFDGFVEMR